MTLLLSGSDCREVYEAPKGENPAGTQRSETKGTT